MVKDLWNEEGLAKRYKHLIQERPILTEVEQQILKAADRFETCLFVASEMALGNSSLSGVFERTRNAFIQHMGLCGKEGEGHKLSKQLIERLCRPVSTLDWRGRTDSDEQELPFDHGE